MTVHMTVALGATDDSYLIAAGGRTRTKHVPDGMKAALAGKVATPIDFASIGEDNKWFIAGRDPADSSKYITRFNTGGLTTLSDKMKSSKTTGACFGHGKAWSWFHQHDKSYHWSYGGLEDNQIAWIKKMKTEHGEAFRIFIGAGHATVLLFADGRIAYHDCGEKTANTLSAAARKGLRIRYIGLSPTHRDWFFIQFKDGSVTWNLSKDIAEHVKEYAKDKGLQTRAVETL